MEWVILGIVLLNVVCTIWNIVSIVKSMIAEKKAIKFLEENAIYCDMDDIE